MPLDSDLWESYPSGNSDEDPRFERALRALENGDLRTAVALLESKAPANAEEHLWRAQPEARPEAALMLATLLESPYHKPSQDVASAKQFYEIASRASYPLAMVKLARIATSERRWRQAMRLVIQAVRLIVQLRLRDPRDRRLIGFLPRRP